MKKIKKHSAENFCKGCNTYSLFNNLTEFDNSSDFLGAKNIGYIEKERAWKVLKLFSFSVILEHFLIDKMREKFKTFNQNKQKEIKNEIIEIIKKQQRVTCIEAEKILNEELGKFDISNIITTPIIQYIAEYTSGSLINFTEKNFSINKNTMSEFREFNKNRNYVVHNSTSSREDIDKHLESGLKKGSELKKLLE